MGIGGAAYKVKGRDWRSQACPTYPRTGQVSGDIATAFTVSCFLCLSHACFPSKRDLNDQCQDHILQSNAPGRPCCAKAGETVLQRVFVVRPSHGSRPHGSGGESPLRDTGRATAPCHAGGNGRYPASGPQPHFEDTGNCLSNVTIKISFFWRF